MTDAINKRILGINLKLQYPGKAWKNDDTGKSGITKESISMSKGRSYIEIDPLELLGLWSLNDSKKESYDKIFIDEVNRRAEIQAKTLRAFIPK